MKNKELESKIVDTKIDIHKLIEKISNKVGQYEEATGDWGNLGDLNHVKNNLEDVCEFLGIDL